MISSIEISALKILTAKVFSIISNYSSEYIVVPEKLKNPFSYLTS